MTESEITSQVRLAISEDVGSGDVTAGLIPPDHHSAAQLVTREYMVLCGKAWFDEVFKQLDPTVTIEWLADEGDWLEADSTICNLNGNTRSLLTGERTAMNFLQTLSGVATLSRRYAEAVKPHAAKVLDTRKTIPGLRSAQKYAVSCGGCENHRMGLYDAILIKENHIQACGSISNAIQSSRRLHPELTVEVEVENLHELQQALDAGADRILLDNFNLDETREAVRINNHKAILESSGNVTLKTVNAIAATGVDYISTGSLTKNILAIDLSLRFVS